MSPSLPRPLAAARVLLAAMLLAAALVAQSAASATAATKCGVLPGHACARLTFSLFGNGSGRFQSLDTDGGVPTGRIDCQLSGGIASGTCANTFDVVSPFDTLYWRETPAAGSEACYIVVGCSPNSFDTNTSASGTVTDSDHGFRLVNPSTVTVARKGNGSGSVKSNPRGITCGGRCQVAFASGQPVTLTASAAAGSVFGGWSNGPCSGKSATCTFTPTAATVIDATFNAVPKPTPVLTLAPSDSPTVQPSPSASPSELVEAASAGSSASASPSASSSPAAAASDPPSSGSDTLPIAIAIVLAALLIGAGLAIGLARGLRSRSAKPPA